MTGRAAAACALYAAFLAVWAFAGVLLRRGAGSYLLLSMALLEATLLVGTAASALQLPAMAGEVAVHAGYVVASVLILPIGVLLARTADRELDSATLAVALLALAVVVVRVDATAG